MAKKSIDELRKKEVGVFLPVMLILISIVIGFYAAAVLLFMLAANNGGLLMLSVILAAIFVGLWKLNKFVFYAVLCLSFIIAEIFQGSLANPVIEIVVLPALLIGLWKWQKLAVYAFIAVYAVRVFHMGFENVLQDISTQIIVLLPLLYLWAIKSKWHLFR